MGTQGGNGGLSAGRSQLLLFWLVVVLVFVVFFQFIAYTHEQTSSFLQGSLPTDSQAQQAFENTVGKFLLSPKDNSRESANVDVRDLLEKLCATSAGDLEPASQLTGQRAEICDLMADKKQIGALKEENARLYEIMENATILMDLRNDRKEDEKTERSYQYFMSSLEAADSVRIKGQFEFPSKASLGRLLCLQGNNRENGTQNKYGFAWKEHLPPNATLFPGLTLVTNTDWEHDVDNIYHGLNFIAPYASWISKGLCAVPERLLLYTHGQVVDGMMSWMEHLLHAIFGRNVPVETAEEQLVARGKEANSLACFERAVVTRHWIHGESDTVKRIFETLRCRARAYCEVQFAPAPASEGGASLVQVSLVLREGSRAFKDASAVQRAIERAIQEHGNSRLEVAYSANLTFCQQVALFSRTDVLITSHGAQITNMIFMPKGSSVMENMAFGWEESGPGQYVFAWLGAKIEVHHEGYWYDPEGPPCPHPAEDKTACFMFYKGGLVGHNETHLTEWTSTVLKKFDGVIPPSRVESHDKCPCT